MKINWSLAASLSVHAAILLAALVVLPEPEHFKVEEHDQIPVDIVSIEDVAMRSAMSKTAPEKTDKPAPPKVEPKQVDPRPAPKAAEVPNDAVKEPAPAPPPTPEKKPDPPTPDKPTPDPAQMAELLKKTENQQTKQEQERPKPKPKPPAPPKKKIEEFDPEKIAALLDKDLKPPQTAPAPSDTTGTPARGETDFLNGTDPRMAANDIDWLRQKIAQCWSPPVGVREAQNLIVRIRIGLAQDGTVVGQPEVMNSSADPLFNAAAGAAMRAVLGCQPYDKLPPGNYEIWKEIILNFDPSQMITG